MYYFIFAFVGFAWAHLKFTVVIAFPNRRLFFLLHNLLLWFAVDIVGSEFLTLLLLFVVDLKRLLERLWFNGQLIRIVQRYLVQLDEVNRTIFSWFRRWPENFCQFFPQFGWFINTLFVVKLFVLGDFALLVLLAWYLFTLWHWSVLVDVLPFTTQHRFGKQTARES